MSTLSPVVPVVDSNQYDVLSSPHEDEGKTQEGMRARFGKDDIKEQAYHAREVLTTKVRDLKDQVARSGIVETVQSQLQPAIDVVKEKVEIVKEKVGIPKEATKEEIAAKIEDEAGGEWEEVKRKGHKQAQKAKHAIDSKLDENLTKEQRAKLNKGLRSAKRGALQLEGQAQGWSNHLVNVTLSGPNMRPLKSFIKRNHLQLPAVILGAVMTMWLGLFMIRLLTTIATPKVPEFDIHSKDATMNWLKYHMGEYKDQAVDLKDSLSGRAASFLANYEWDKLRGRAIDWKDVGLNKLGLREPTWGEWAWARMTGHPITWQERVESVLTLAKDGIGRVDLQQPGFLERVKNRVLHATGSEPTLGDKANQMFETIKSNAPDIDAGGIVNGIKTKLGEGIDSVRSHLPDGAETLDSMKQRAQDAIHPSTIDQLKSGANYIKNRVVHGAQEAAHIVQDRFNEVADKAKYKAGL